jgi:chaperonin GroES
MANTIKPLGERILIKRHQEKEQIKDGIIIPDNAKERSQEGEVIALGTGRKNDKGEILPFNVKVGDRVLLPQYGGTEVKINGNEHLIVKEDDILGVIG